MSEAFHLFEADAFVAKVRFKNSYSTVTKEFGIYAAKPRRPRFTADSILQPLVLVAAAEPRRARCRGTAINDPHRFRGFRILSASGCCRRIPARMI